jgi:hypothetical protein
MSNPAELKTQTAVAMSSGGQQASAAFNAGGAAQSQMPHHQGVNKFDKGLRDLEKGAALGVNAQEAIRLRSKGHHDMTKDIKLSIKKQYFSMTQAMQTFVWGIIAGMFTGALIVAMTAPNALMLMEGKTASQIWAIFVLSAGVSAVFLRYFTRPSIRRCSKDEKYDVEPEFQGRECLEADDCTDKTEPNWESCRLPKLGTTSRFVQGVFPWAAIFFGVVLILFGENATELRPHPTDVAQAVIYGIFSGSALMFVFSF